ncbi:MAG TPA: carboxypeptidase regulatory-like domain-containing protein [Thermoanaerobaculia bacterium]
MRSALVVLVSLLAAGADARAAARLVYNLQNRPTPIEWPAGAFPLPFAVSRSAAQNLATGEALVAGAFEAWEGIEGSRVSFRNTGITDAPAGRDGVNVVTVNDALFDESGFVAFTTTWFDQTTGVLQEADIQIDASAAKNGVGLGTLVQHEIGHLLGLDHSGIVSSVMFPWVGPEDLAGLDSDERIALAQIYPEGGGKMGPPRIRGSVRLPRGGVFGAQVVAVDANGAPVSSTLTAADGTFELAGLPPGHYRVYAEPLDGPVETKNLSGVWRDVQTGFRPGFAPEIDLQPGGSADGVEIGVNEFPETLNPRWIGAFAPGASEIRLSSTLLSTKQGATVAIAVGGDGIVSGMTQFEVLNPGFTRTSDFAYGPNYVWAAFRVSPDAPTGSVVILARNGNDVAPLTGALRVEASSPPPRGRVARR